MKYKLYMNFKNFKAGEGEYTKDLIRFSDDLDELVNILNKYINKFMQIKEDGWQYFKGDIQNLSVESYNLERHVYEISLTKKGIGA